MLKLLYLTFIISFLLSYDNSLFIKQVNYKDINSSQSNISQGNINIKIDSNGSHKIFISQKNILKNITIKKDINIKQGIVTINSFNRINRLKQSDIE